MRLPVATEEMTMPGSQLCPNCGMSVGLNEDTCDTCRMYVTGQSDARLYPILGLIACWALIPIFTGLLLSYMGSGGETTEARPIVAISKPVVVNMVAPKTLSLGEWAIIRLEVKNPGNACFGQMRLSFPTMLDLKDSENIRAISCSEGDQPGLSLTAVGTPIQHKEGKPTLARHWFAQFADFCWQKGETNVIQVKVRPKRAGLFTFRYSAAFGTEKGLWRVADKAQSGPDGEGWLYSARAIDVRPLSP